MSQEERQRRVQAIRSEITDAQRSIQRNFNTLQRKVSKEHIRNKAEKVMEQTAEDLKERAGQSAAKVRDAAEDQARKLADRAQHTAEAAGDQLQLAGQRAERAAREHPVPTVLLGAGACWIAYELGRRSSSGLQRRTDELHGRAKEGAAQVSQDLVDHGADFVRQRPLTAGALALAGGLLVGAALPQGVRERRVLQPAREHLGRQAQGLAQDVGAVGREAVVGARDAIRDEAESRGLIITGEERRN